MTDSQEALLNEIREVTEAKPYKVYGDYRDELSPEQVATLLESREKFDEEFWEIEINASDYADWSEHHDEIIEKFGARIMAEFPDDFAKNDSLEDLEWRDMPSEVVNAFHESTVVDCSDLLDTMLRNSRVNIVALVINADDPDNDHEIGPPHGELDAEENEKRQRYLEETFGIDGWKAESCYSHERLKVMGRLDLREVYEKGKPVAITISPGDTLIFHTSWNGSGCLGDVKATKTVTMPAAFKVDSLDRYGVQEVYGFVGEMWSGGLEVAEWEPWQ